VCRYESPDDARYCFNPSCLTPLDPTVTSEAPAIAPPPEDRHRVRHWLWASGAFGAGCVGVVGALLATGAFSGSAAKPAPPTTVVTTIAPATTAATPKATAAVRGTPIDPKLIVSSQATSTLPSQDGLTYGINNTLDGQITTGWNSEGSTPGHGVPPVGQKLDYKLAASEHIVGVRIINGFNPNDGKHQFTDNYRVHTLAIRAGGKERRVDLADSFVPQFVEVNFPNADSLELEVLSVYPTTKWQDVGITEVQIFVAQP
jgi:hypothetical protein